MQDAHDFDDTVTKAKENRVGVDEGRPQSWHYLITSPPHEGLIREPPAGLLDFAQ